MNPLAADLNQTIRQENPYIFEMLSDLGRALFFPRGILSQTAEARQRAHRFNATIGIAIENDEPMHLPVIQDTLSAYDPTDIYTYAPPAGKPELRAAWRQKLERTNPSMVGKTWSQPIVTSALTHGLSIVSDLFVNPGDVLILPDKYWGNYNLTFSVRRGAEVVTFPLFSNDGFNAQGLRDTLMALASGHSSDGRAPKAILLLNFPNNPTGYTPDEAEADAIVASVIEAAEAGLNLVVALDDAYFGLFFEDTIKESLFGRLIDVHERVLPVKIDGATKEEYVWGFRVGFITYGGGTEPLLHALEQKTIGSIRGAISSASHPAQTFVWKALESPRYEGERLAKYEILKTRANRVKEILSGDRFSDAWTYYPFNSGYFMTLRLHDVDAETLRVHLLDRHGVGTISAGPYDLRIAFSCIEAADLQDLFDLIYQGVKELKAAE